MRFEQFWHSLNKCWKQSYGDLNYVGDFIMLVTKSFDEIFKKLVSNSKLNSCVVFWIFKSKSPLAAARSMLRGKFTSFSGSEPEILRFVDAIEVISVRRTSSPNQLSFFIISSSRKGDLDFKIQKPTQLLYEKKPTHLLIRPD